MQTEWWLDKKKAAKTPNRSAQSAQSSSVLEPSLVDGPPSAARTTALQQAVGNQNTSTVVSRKPRIRGGSGSGGSYAGSAGSAGSSIHSGSATRSFTGTPAMQGEVANPHLYGSMANLDNNTHRSFVVGPAHEEPNEGYFDQEQHCAYMSTYWLRTSNHGNLPFTSLPKDVQRSASTWVDRWHHTADPLGAQVEYAVQRLGGGAHQVTHQALAGDIQHGTLPRGSLIWFGNNHHVMACYVGSRGYVHYDPNTGRARSVDGQGLLGILASQNVFVVKVGPGADKKSCACCAVM